MYACRPNGPTFALLTSYEPLTDMRLRAFGVPGFRRSLGHA